MKIVLMAVALLVFPLAVSAMGSEPHEDNTCAYPAEANQQVYKATGKIKSIAEDHMSLRIFHDPIPELKWPAMNMAFDVIDHDLTHPLEVGDTVRFEFIQKEGKQIITKISK
ncbi:MULTISPECIES: copper-binding protein [unclassified Sulfuricurvum]|uniref:copper-binding protein n=1 Tax=unclassified Sulfuricurvum TaxID=2632390 RepID=UPI000A773F09|nr:MULTISPECIES: copper-binding protein [unclassified Sulfuricurvum]